MSKSKDSIQSLISKLNDDVDDINQNATDIKRDSSILKRHINNINDINDILNNSSNTHKNKELVPVKDKKETGSKHWWEKKASKKSVAFVCFLGFWLLLFIIALAFQHNNLIAGFITAAITSALFIYPLFYSNDMKKWTIKFTIAFGVLLLIVIVLLGIFSII